MTTALPTTFTRFLAKSSFSTSSTRAATTHSNSLLRTTLTNTSRPFTSSFSSSLFSQQSSARSFSSTSSQLNHTRTTQQQQQPRTSTSTSPFHPTIAQSQRRTFSTTRSNTKPATTTTTATATDTTSQAKPSPSSSSSQSIARWFLITGGAATAAYLLLPYAVPIAHAEAAAAVAVGLGYPSQGTEGIVRGGQGKGKGKTVPGRGGKTEEENEQEEDEKEKEKEKSIINAPAPTPATTTTTISEIATTSSTSTLPQYRLADIASHDKSADSYWVVRGTRVYDITEWVPNHPGGDVILRAAGGDVDAYWKIFTVHLKEDVYDILEQYLIGEVDQHDLVNGKPAWATDVSDPFVNDPARDARLVQHTARPCNAETPSSELSDYITPTPLFYVRNHFWVPEATEEQHTLTIEREDGTEIVYTMEELRRRFKEHNVTATLQCAGNRRSHMTAAVGKTNGLQWNVGAIGNAVWTGVLLRDVLADAGLPVEDVPEDVRHATFSGTESYAASIPIEKIADKRGDVLLAYGMNGETLPRDHGYPLRVVVPGHVAARSVKWVNRISLSDEESTSQWQRKDYKLFGPNVGSNPNWDSAPSIQEMPVQSAVTRIVKGAFRSSSEKDAKDDTVLVEGYAVVGGGRRIVRVDVSADSGKTWGQATLLKGEGDAEDPAPKQAWSWQRWTFNVPEKVCAGDLVVKAVDEGYNSQPDGFGCHYNHRGNLARGWHRIPLAANRAEASA